METNLGLIFVKVVSKSSRANVVSLALCNFALVANTHTLTASCGCVAVVASVMAEFWLLSGSAPLNLNLASGSQCPEINPR